MHSTWHDEGVRKKKTKNYSKSAEKGDFFGILMWHVYWIENNLNWKNIFLSFSWSFSDIEKCKQISSSLKLFNEREKSFADWKTFFFKPNFCENLLKMRENA